MALILDKDKLNSIFNLPDNMKVTEDLELDDDMNVIDIDAQKIESTMSSSKKKIECDQDIYDRLNELIQSGNELFDSVKMIIQDNPDGEMLSGASSLINSIKDIMKEFTKLHNMKMKFEQQKELEMIKARLKQDQILLKSQETQKLIAKKLNMGSGSGTLDNSPVDMVSYCQEEVIKALNSAKPNQQSDTPINIDSPKNVAVNLIAYQ